MRKVDLGLQANRVLVGNKAVHLCAVDAALRDREPVTRQPHTPAHHRTL